MIKFSQLKTGLLFILGLLAMGITGRSLAAEPPVLHSFRSRIPALKKQIPSVTKCAEAAVKRVIAHPDLVIRYPWPRQLGFSDEFIARAGALANWGSDDGTVAPNDIMIYTVRSWEEDAAEAKEAIAQYHNNGWLVILFASHKGMPKDLPKPDFLIDNHASSGNKAEGNVNFLINMMNCWSWQCEYVSALTRKGQRPGVLKSMFLPDGMEFNDTINPKTILYPCDTKIKKGVLGKAYLARIDQLIADLAGPARQQQLTKAVDVIVKQIEDGKQVGVLANTHVMPFELMRPFKSPFKRAENIETLSNDLKPGDLLIFFSYLGLSSQYSDCAKFIHEAKLLLVTNFTPDEDASNNAPDALARVDSSWVLGDAEVKLPFSPERMAPISAINQTIIFYMIDDGVAERLAKDKGSNIE